jgi:2-polyprenyl-6-hydroxyphenyl methylase/3-demethylubiquinone-9 3-methyltransferase
MTETQNSIIIGSALDFYRRSMDDRRSMNRNVDDSEIRKFEAQTPYWWDPQGEFKGLHDINPLRLRYIDERVRLKGKSVLDVGCGGGILAESMAAVGAAVTGIDAGAAPLAAARRHGRLSGRPVDYRQVTAEELAQIEPAAYDVVTCMELLEHVPEPESVVRACARLVKPGGDVFFATLNRTLKAFALAVVAAEYILGIVKRGTHSYRKFLKPAEIDTWSRTAGLICQDLSGLHYNPVLKKKYLGGDADVNFLMHFRRETGGVPDSAPS